MANISQEVDIELLEKKPDGTYVKKNPATKAEIVELQDTANKFTSTTVEGALKESIDRADEAFIYGNNRKIETVDALLSVDDSLPITSGNNWSEVIGAIGGISTGKKWASGTVTDWNGSVDGLGFTPKVVMLYAYASGGPNMMVYNRYFGHALNLSKILTSYVNGDSYSSLDKSRGITITSGGFTYGHSGLYGLNSINWIAFE